MVADLTRRRCECSRPSAPDRKDCHACSKRRWREKNPLLAHFRRIKDRAVRKRIAFSLTFDEFAEFCAESGYLDRVGCGAPDDLQIDRRDARLGYSRENIQPMGFLDNARKGAGERGRVLVEGPF